MTLDVLNVAKTDLPMVPFSSSLRTTLALEPLSLLPRCLFPSLFPRIHSVPCKNNHISPPTIPLASYKLGKKLQESTALPLLSPVTEVLLSGRREFCFTLVPKRQYIATKDRRGYTCNNCTMLLQGRMTPLPIQGTVDESSRKETYSLVRDPF